MKNIKNLLLTSIIAGFSLTPSIASAKGVVIKHFGYAVLADSQNNLYIELGYKDPKEALEIAKKNCLGANRGNCYLLSTGNKRFVATALQVSGNKFVSAIGKQRTGVGARGSNESVKDAERSSKFSCKANAPKRNVSCHTLFVFDQQEQYEWSFVGQESSIKKSSRAIQYKLKR